MKKHLLSVVLVITLLFNLNCKKSPTEPAPDNIQPGRRDYAWTVDTLSAPYNTFFRIWGSSPNDVWTVSPPGMFNKSIFHFNGNKWSSDGVSRFFSPKAVFGFASNDVWSAGSDGDIWRYDGNNWKQFVKLTKDEHNDIVFDNIWGESQNDIYAIGAYHDNNGLPNHSVIAHFVNNEWVMFNTDSIKGIVEHLYKNKKDQLIYLQVVKFSNTYDSTFIYKYEEGSYTKLYSTIWSKTWSDICLIDNEVFFVLKDEIARRINNQFQRVLKIEDSNFYQKIWGRNTEDIFLLMTDGLAHYDGIDLKYLFHFNKSGTIIYDAALFEKEVFFLVSEGQTNLNLIYHGVLK